MFRVNMLFSIVSISNSKYCFNICTLLSLEIGPCSKASCIFDHCFFEWALLTGGGG